MEIDLPIDYVKLGVNIQEGDIITLLDEGHWTEQMNKKGEEFQSLKFKCEISSGEVKEITVNRPSIMNLIKAYGKDSKRWEEKPLRVWCVRYGKNKALVLSPKSWTDAFEEGEKQAEPKSGDIPVIEETRNGHYKGEPKKKIDLGADEAADQIDVKDIPF